MGFGLLKYFILVCNIWLYTANNFRKNDKKKILQLYKILKSGMI